MTITIKTANMRYGGADRLDITIKSSKGIARQLAPTWRMVMNSKSGAMSHASYEKYYRNLIWFRYKMNPQRFIELLSQDRTLVCYCRAGTDFCHRYFAADILGEIAKRHEIHAKIEKEPIDYDDDDSANWKENPGAVEYAHPF